MEVASEATTAGAATESPRAQEGVAARSGRRARMPSHGLDAQLQFLRPDGAGYEAEVARLVPDESRTPALQRKKKGTTPAVTPSAGITAAPPNAGPTRDEVWGCDTDKALALFPRFAALDDAAHAAAVAAIGPTGISGLWTSLPESRRGKDAAHRPEAMRLLRDCPELARTVARELLSYGLFDWEITSVEADIAFRIIKGMPSEARREFIRLDGGKWWFRMQANASTALRESADYHLYDAASADALKLRLGQDELWLPARRLELAAVLRMLVHAGAADEAEREAHRRGLGRDAEGQAILSELGLAPAPGKERPTHAPRDPSKLESLGAGIGLLFDAADLVLLAGGKHEGDVDLERLQTLLGGNIAGARIENRKGGGDAGNNTLHLGVDADLGQFTVRLPRIDLGAYASDIRTELGPDGLPTGDAGGRVTAGKTYIEGLAVVAKWPTERSKECGFAVDVGKVGLSGLVVAGKEGMKTLGSLGLDGLTMRAKAPPWLGMPKNQAEFVMLVLEEMAATMGKMLPGIGPMVTQIFGEPGRAIEAVQGLVASYRGAEGLELGIKRLSVDGAYDDKGTLALDHAEVDDVSVKASLRLRSELLMEQLAAARTRGDEGAARRMEAMLTAQRFAEARLRELEWKQREARAKARQGVPKLTDAELKELRGLRERCYVGEVSAAIGHAEVRGGKVGDKTLAGAEVDDVEIGARANVGYAMNDEGQVTGEALAATLADQKRTEAMLAGSRVSLGVGRAAMSKGAARAVQVGEGEGGTRVERAEVGDVRVDAEEGEQHLAVGTLSLAGLELGGTRVGALACTGTELDLRWPAPERGGGRFSLRTSVAMKALELAGEPPTKVDALSLKGVALELGEPPTREHSASAAVEAAQGVLTQLAGGAIGPIGAALEAQAAGRSDGLGSALAAAITRAVGAVGGMKEARLRIDAIEVDGLSGKVAAKKITLARLEASVGWETASEALAIERERIAARLAEPGIGGDDKRRLEARVGEIERRLPEVRAREAEMARLAARHEAHARDPERCPELGAKESQRLAALRQELVRGRMTLGLGALEAEGVEAGGATVERATLGGAGKDDGLHVEAGFDAAASAASITAEARLGVATVRGVKVPAERRRVKAEERLARLEGKAKEGALAPPEASERRALKELLDGPKGLRAKDDRLQALLADKAKAPLAPADADELARLESECLTPEVGIAEARLEDVRMSADADGAELAIGAASVRGAHYGDVALDEASLSGVAVRGDAGPSGLANLGAALGGKGEIGGEVSIASASIKGLTRGEGVDRIRVAGAELEGLALGVRRGADGVMAASVSVRHAGVHGVELGGSQLEKVEARARVLRDKAARSRLEAGEADELRGVQAELERYHALQRSRAEVVAAIEQLRARDKRCRDAADAWYEQTKGQRDVAHSTWDGIAELYRSANVARDSVKPLERDVADCDRRLAAWTERPVVKAASADGVGLALVAPEGGTAGMIDAGAEGSGKDGTALERASVEGVSAGGVRFGSLATRDVKVRSSDDGTRRISVGEIGLGQLDAVIGDGVLEVGGMSLHSTALTLHLPPKDEESGQRKSGAAWVEAETALVLAGASYRTDTLEANLGLLSVGRIAFRADANLQSSSGALDLGALFTEHLRAATLRIESVGVVGASVRQKHYDPQREELVGDLSVAMPSASLGSLAVSVDLSDPSMGQVGLHLSQLAAGGAVEGGGIGRMIAHNLGLGSLDVTLRSSLLGDWIAGLGGKPRPGKAPVGGADLAASFLENLTTVSVPNAWLGGLSFGTGGLSAAVGAVQAGVTANVRGPSATQPAVALLDLPVELIDVAVAHPTLGWIKAAGGKLELRLGIFGGKLTDPKKNALTGFSEALLGGGLELITADVPHLSLRGVETSYDEALKTTRDVGEAAVFGPLGKSLMDWLRGGKKETSELLVEGLSTSLAPDQVTGGLDVKSLDLRTAQATVQGYTVGVRDQLASWLGSLLAGFI